MTPKQYVVRIYITRGIAIKGGDQAQSYYLRLKQGNLVKDLTSSLPKKQKSANPEFYISEDFICELPGSAFLRIELLQERQFHLRKDPIVGYTEIDLEHRFFSRKW